MRDPLIYPVIALMLLTCLVWFYMYFKRLTYVTKNKINPQKLSTPEQCNSILPAGINKPSNNFKNLFEAPVIFYVLCLLVIFTQLSDTITVYMAWLYVAGRYIHSAFHCLGSSVLARFYAYLISTLILWVMLFKVIYQLSFN